MQDIQNSMVVKLKASFLVKLFMIGHPDNEYLIMNYLEDNLMLIHVKKY
jgi:hypothetical protein